MTSSSPLDGLLAVCDELRAIQEVAARGGSPSPDALLRVREALTQFQAVGFDSLPGVAANPLAGHLTDAELLLLALLFHRRVAGRSGEYEGSTLISLMNRAGLVRSRGLEILGPDSPLRQGEWLIASPGGGGLDPVDCTFQASKEALALFWPPLVVTNSAKTPNTPTPEAPAAYSSEQEYLWDLLQWRQLCLQRAASLFDVEPPQVGGEVPEAAELREAAHSTWVRIRERLAQTPHGRDFGLERLAQEFHLGPDHVLMICHLFFGETLEADLFHHPSECLRVVAARREDVFHRRRMIAPNSRLRREGIVLTEGDDSAKMLLLPLCLADWVVDRILGGLQRSPNWNAQDLEDFLRGETER